MGCDRRLRRLARGAQPHVLPSDQPDPDGNRRHARIHRAARDGAGRIAPSPRRRLGVARRSRSRDARRHRSTRIGLGRSVRDRRRMRVGRRRLRRPERRPPDTPRRWSRAGTPDCSADHSPAGDRARKRGRRAIARDRARDRGRRSDHPVRARTRRPPPHRAADRRRHLQHRSSDRGPHRLPRPRRAPHAAPTSRPGCGNDRERRRNDSGRRPGSARLRSANTSARSCRSRPCM